MVGSPIYMSPEQLNSSKDVDGRTDIWALGVILYELIAGRTPFYGESIAQLVNAVLNTEPEGFAPLGIESPPGLDQVIRKALSKARDQRYASARELYNALSPFAGERAGSISGVHSQRPPAATRSMSGSEVAPRPLPSALTPQSEQTSVAGSRTRSVLLALGLIALAGVAALLSRRGEQAPDHEARRAPPSTLAPPAAASLAAEPAPTAAPIAEPPSATTAMAATADAEATAAEGSGAEAGTDVALPVGVATPPATVGAAVPPQRPRERVHAKVPAGSAPAGKPESSDDYLPNFGGRR
jgi:serine/threonine-protein kinase